MSIFVDIAGVVGESSDAGHKGWMDVESISWGVDRQINSSTSTEGDRESSNAVINDLTLHRGMDSCTPKLFIESCSGTGKDVVIHLTKTGTGSGANVYMEYTLKNALISHYSVSAHSEDTSRPSETIVISFVDLEVKYTPYDEDGNAEAAIAVGFNTATNSKR
jgi:type VI secretion system secreted protein Hcp